jgi:DNA polymerase-3 subunit gamma/tau
MPKALYRKYRSKSLSEIVGQDHITKTLENSLKTGKFSHAYLFTGPRGTGKTSIARILAHKINNFSYELEDDYLDIIEIDAASNTGVDNIRDLREKAMIAPTKGNYKIYIIDEVHMLSKSAFNALLKTLEEPPAHVIFIMATTDAHKVPATIISRSQQFNFKLANPETMFSHLKSIAKKEAIKISDNALKIIVNRGGGSFRDSLSLLDQISTLSSDEISTELINSALGLPSDELISSLLSAYETANSTKITTILADLNNLGIKPELIAEELLKILIKNPKPNLLPLLELLPETPRSPFPEAKLLLALLNNTGVSVEPSPKTIVQPLQEITAPNVEEKSNPSQPGECRRGAGSAPTSSPTAATATREDGLARERTPDENGLDFSATSFNLETFLETIKIASPQLFSYLSKLQIIPTETELIILIDKPFTKTILEKPNNQKIMRESVPLKIVLKSAADKLKENPKLAALSDIIGPVQEVKIDGELI